MSEELKVSVDSSGKSSTVKSADKEFKKLEKLGDQGVVIDMAEKHVGTASTDQD